MVNRHDRLRYYTLFERVVFIIIKYHVKRKSVVKIIRLQRHVCNITGMFSLNCEPYIVTFMCCIFITTGHMFFNFLGINSVIFRKAM